MRVPTKTSSLSGKSGAEAVAEQIRCRAYELYEERGRGGGLELKIGSAPKARSSAESKEQPPDPETKLEQSPESIRGFSV
jgi:hypothetical protein